MAFRNDDGTNGRIVESKRDTKIGFIAAYGEDEEREEFFR